MSGCEGPSTAGPCSVRVVWRVIPNYLSTHHPPIYLSTYQAAASAELQRMNAFFTDVDQGSLEVETLPAPP